MSTTTTLQLELDNGSILPLRQQQAQTSGNTYWAVLASKANGDRYYNKRGVMVTEKAVGSELPKSITFAGTTIPTVAGVSDKGKPRVTATAQVQVPGHGRKTLAFRITSVDEGVFNVSAIINGGTGGVRAVDEL